MNYGEVLSKAWQIIWRHKVLWLFGILAGFGSTGGNMSSGSRNVNTRFEQGQIPGFENFGRGVERFFEQIPVWAWMLLVLGGLVLMVIGVLLTTVGRIGLVRGAAQADDGAARLSFGPLFSESMPYFWRVFGLNLLVGLALFAVVIGLVLMGVLFGALTLGIGFLCLLPLICLAVPLAWFIDVVVKQANIAIILENRGIFEGLQRGWEVATRNLGSIFVLMFILLIGGWIAAAIVGLPMLLAIGPFVAATVVGGDQAVRAGLVGAMALACLYLPILLLLNGLIQSYITATWTLAFRRLTGRGPAGSGVEVYPG